MQATAVESSAQVINFESHAGEERYVLRTRRDVLPVFLALAKWPIPITVCVDQLGTSFPSRLIAVNPAFEELVFDASELAGGECLDGSAGLAGEAQMDGVWFRFEAGHVSPVQGYALPAFRARLPTMLSRLQRRDSIRYPVPGLNPPVCDTLFAAAGDTSQRLRAIDISYSGISLCVDDTRLNLATGSTLAGCMLHLPDIGAIATDLLVMYLSPFGQNDQRRMGCRFTNVRATSLDHLRRYISRLERERLKVFCGV